MFTPPRRTVTAPASIDNSGLPQTTSPSPTAASNSRRQSTSLISALPANNKSKGANLAQTQDLTKDQEDIFLSFEPRPPRLLISEFKPSPEAEARVEFNRSFYEKNSWARFISQAKKYQIFDAQGDIEKSVEAYKEKFKEANSERHENYAKFYEFVTSKWGTMSNEEQHEVLHLAISYNSTDILKFLFTQKIDVTSPDSNGIRPIHVAAARGDLAILKSLVKKGAKLNEPNAFGEVAWQIALNNNNKDVIPYLLEKSEDDEGNFPVHIATATCDTRMLGYLRDQGADFLKLNANNQTALQVAFRNETGDANKTDQANKINKKNESINFFKELYSHFWDPLIIKNETDKENLVKHMSHDERVQAVCIAANSNDQEMINILAEYKADIKSPDRHGDLPIHIAATYSTAHALFYLVQEEAKSSIKAQIEDGKTVLQTADVYNKTLNTLTINERDKRTVLQTADLHESEQVLAGFKQLYLAGNYTPQHDLDKDLLAKHMNPDERSKELHKALQQDDNVMLESLLRHGVAVNSRSGNYDLPIHIAIAKGDVNAVWRLVAVGADLNQSTLGGGSTLQIAEFFGKANVWACIKQLYLSGAYVPTHESDKNLLTKNMSTDERSYALHIALSQNDRAMMNSLFEYEINVNARDANGNLPIHLAVANDNVYAVQRLVAMGAELNDLAATEVTTLQIAEHGEKANVLNYIKQLYLNGSYVPKYDLDKDLLARNMGPDERSEALHRALFQNDKLMMGNLFKYGVDVNTRDANGNPPIHHAIANDDIDTLRHLMAMGANLNALNTNTQTIFQVARNSGKTEVLSFLKQLYFSEMTYTPRHDVDKDLLVKEMNANERAIALFKSVIQKDLQMIDILFSNDYDLHSKIDDDHNFPIHLIAGHEYADSVSEHKDIEMFSYFLENGSDLNATNKFGETTLQISVEMKNKGVFNLIKKHYLSNNNYIPNKRSDKQDLAKIMTIEELKTALKMEKSKQSIAMTTILRLELLKKRVLRQ